MRKIYLSVLFCLLSMCVIGQPSSFSSVDEVSGDWTTSSTWQNGTGSPCTECANKVTISINGAVTHGGDLSFDNGATLNIKAGDTLIVLGNMSLFNNAVLNVESGGVLIVSGNFHANNNLGVDADGSIVVAGDFTAEQNTKIDVTNGYLYVAGTYDPGKNVTVVGSETHIGDENFLQANDLSLYNFINDFLNIPLPVELLYFRAGSSAQGVQLAWASAKEWDFSHYTLEHSANGRDFTPLHIVYGTGDSYTARQYSYLDQQPAYGANYYRLKTTDIDGSEEYKGIVLAYSGTKGGLELAPNPAQGGRVNLRYLGASEGTWVSILNASGVEMARLQMGEQNMVLPVTNFSRGLYLIKVWNQFESKQTRLVIP